jgi:hypothetical protein
LRNREIVREKHLQENKTTTNQKERDEKLTSFGVTKSALNNAKSRNRVLEIIRGKQSNSQPKRRDEVNPASGIVTGEDARRWIKFDLN